MIQKEISIAPMLNWTDRHFRFFLRLICKNPLFYTEMIPERAIVNNPILRDSLKPLSLEQPLALQIGGSSPDILMKCANIATEQGFKEINLNAGCPSSRVQAGAFGASLMCNPELLADCVYAIKKKTTLPVSVKTRIALEGTTNTYEQLHHFVQTVSKAGCQKFIIHARNVKMTGFSPKENRTKLPLNYPAIHQLKIDLPHLFIVINGNISNVEDISHQIQFVDGAMIGRTAYINPYFLSLVDSLFYEDNHPVLNRFEIIERMLPYLEEQQKNGIPLSYIECRMFGLFHAHPLSKEWKKALMLHDTQSIKDFMALHTKNYS